MTRAHWILLAALILGCRSPDKAPAGAAREAPSQPDLSRRSASVGRQIEAARSRYREAVAAGDREAKAVAAGELGMVYHAYSFHDAALEYYAAASALDGAETRWAYYAAVVHLVEGRVEAGLGALHGVLERNPAHVGALLRSGEALLGLGRLAAADESFRRASRLRPSSAKAALGRGRVALQQGDYDIATEAFEEALDLAPAADSLHRLLAACYFRLGDEERARRHRRLAGRTGVPHPDPLLAAVADLAQDVEAQLARGSQEAVFGRLEDALRFYREAVRRDPRSVSARLALGSTLDRTGDVSSARVELESAVALAPDDAAAQYYLASHLKRSGEESTSVAAFRRAVELDPRHLDAWLELGQLLERGAHFEAAMEAYLAVLDLDPQNRAAMLGRAASLIGAGRLTEAEEVLRRQVAEDPESLAARTNYGAVLSGLDRRDAAIEQLRIATGLSGSQRVLALAHFNLGLLEAEGEASEEAVRNLRTALELDPSLSAARERLVALLRTPHRP